MSKKNELPSAFLSRLRTIVPAGLISSVLRAYESGQPITGRVNTLKSTLKDVIKSFASDRIEVIAHEEIPNAFIVTKGNFKRITETDLYTQGCIYLQSLSSQIPPLVLAPKPGERVLDMCAAPGGKTTQMAMLMQNQGEIIACEPEARRFERLMSNAKRQGASIIQGLQMDARKLNPERNGLFDRILLDAPCSSEGTFSLQDPKTYAHWSVDFVGQQSALQQQLISTAATLLKPDGFLVYSTCALSPEENEGVLQGFITKNQGVKLDAIQGISSRMLKGALVEWNQQKYSSQIHQARRIYPSDKTEGFFVALLKKEVA